MRFFKNEALLNEIVDKIFKIIDINANGVIEINELDYFITKACKEMNLQQMPSKEDIKETFDELDEDKNSVIDPEEMRKFLNVLLEDQKKKYSKILNIL